MRITCDSCGAKYNVADEKVSGKTVKIRCKKCSNVILVNGKGETSSAAASPLGEGTSPASGPPAPVIYHVNLSETDQRELQLSDVVSGFREGWITGDMFVWTEGMSDWLPLDQVSAITDAISGALRQEAPLVSAPSYESMSESYLASVPPAGHSAPAASAPIAAPAPSAPAISSPALAPAASASAPFMGGIESSSVEARRVRRDDAREGRDLFAASAGSDPFAFSSSPSSVSRTAAENGEVARASRPAPGLSSSPGLTGERSESSVLFNVGALAVKQPETPSKEDSGIIDLRALVAANEEKASPVVEASEAPIVPLFAVGPASVDVPAVVAQAQPQPQQARKGGMGVFIGVAGVGLLVASAAAAFMMMGKRPVAPPTPVVAAPADPPAKVNEVVQPKTEAASLVSLDDPNEKKVAETKAGATGAPAGGGGNKPAAAAPPAGGGGEVAVAPPPPPKKPAGGDPCGGDLTCMMRNSVKKKPK